MRPVLVKAAIATGVAAALTLGVATAADAHPAADRAPVTYHVAKSGKVTGPSTLAPGLVEVKAAGATGQLAEFVKPKKGVTLAQLVKDGNQLEKNPKPFEHDASFIGGAVTNNVAWLTLTPGTYYIADSSKSKLTASLIKKVVVKGSKSNASAPKAVTLTAIKSMTWAKKPASIPHQGFIRLQNHATQPHFIVMIHIKPGKNFGDVKKVLMGKEKFKQVFLSGAGNELDSAAASPGQSFETAYKLNAGKYALMCFFPGPDGTPHAFMGMARPITLK